MAVADKLALAKATKFISPAVTALQNTVNTAEVDATPLVIFLTEALTLDAEAWLILTVTVLTTVAVTDACDVVVNAANTEAVILLVWQQIESRHYHWQCFVLWFQIVRSNLMPNNHHLCRCEQ